MRLPFPDVHGICGLFQPVTHPAVDRFPRCRHGSGTDNPGVDRSYPHSVSYTDFPADIYPRRWAGIACPNGNRKVVRGGAGSGAGTDVRR